MEKIPHEKYIEIYNGILLFLWFYELANEQGVPNSKLNLANNDFNSFIKKYKYPSGKQYIERGTNVMQLCYLTLVRSHEVMKLHLDSTQVEKIFNKISESPEFSKMTFDDDTITTYDIKIIKFESSKSSSVNLRRFIRHIRNSISHFSYELTGERADFRFISKDPRSNDVNMDIIISALQLLNFTAHFMKIFNNTLKELDYIEQKVP